jgi:hypothetical protein
MGEGCFRVERAVNGFVIKCDDPKIKEENAKSKGGYRDPTKTWTFEDKDKLLAFIGKNIDKMLPEDDYDSAFDKALSSKD